jgi:hypothetical protein
VSSLVSNAPYVMVLDCDMYCNTRSSVLEAMCFHLDRRSRHANDLAFVQFPQMFHNLSGSDIYANELRSIFSVRKYIDHSLHLGNFLKYVSSSWWTLTWSTADAVERPGRPTWPDPLRHGLLRQERRRLRCPAGQLTRSVLVYGGRRAEGKVWLLEWSPSVAASIMEHDFT